MKYKTVVTPDMWQVVWKDYQRGVSIRRISQAYSIPFSRVRSWIREAEERGAPDYDDTGKEAVLMPETNARPEAEASAVEQVQIIERPSIQGKAYDVAEALMNLLYESAQSCSPDDRAGIKHLTGAMKDMFAIKVFRDAMDRKEQEAKIKLLQKQAEDDAQEEMVLEVKSDEEYGE